MLIERLLGSYPRACPPEAAAAHEEAQWLATRQQDIERRLAILECNVAVVARQGGQGEPHRAE